MAKEYISLQEATEYCSYSQEYLSLRARQGKLKAIKFGRNWVTKKEWLNEYLRGIEEYNHSFAKEKKVIAPPKDLPTEEQFKKDIIGLDVRKALKPELQMRFGFVVVFTLSLIVTNLVFGQESFKSVHKDISTFVGSSIHNGIDEVLVDMSKGAQEVVQGINNNIDRKAIEIVRISKRVLGNIFDGTVILKGFVLEMSEIYNIADEFLDKKVVDLGKETYNAVCKSTQAVVSFDDDVVQVTVSAGLPLGASDRSVCAWIKPRDTNFDYIIYYGITTTNHACGLGLVSNKLRFSFYDNDYDSSSDIVANKWQFVCGILKNNGKTVEHYINGNLDRTQSSSNIDTQNRDLHIGDLIGDYNINDFINDVRIYNYALTQEQIKMDYNQGAAVLFK